MLTGYNTDVSFGGELFHVQTEDKGIHSPIILSLVYRAGTILAAKRTPYSNLIQDGIVDESAVSQILTRQHQILVAAIRAGKSDKLVELSRNHSEQAQASRAGNGAANVGAPRQTTDQPSLIETASGAPRTTARHAAHGESYTAPVLSKLEACGFDVIGFDQIIAGYLQHSNYSEQLRIELLYPSKLRAGDEVTVRAAIFLGGHSPSPQTAVQLQVLGTKIGAQSWQACTDLQGLVSFNIKIPSFTSGAAALIIKATAPNGQDTESKFMISVK